MILYVFTASHIDCAERLTHIRRMIDSVRSINLPHSITSLRHYISMSSNFPIKDNWLSHFPKAQCHYHLEIMYKSKRLCQFDHLQSLFEHVEPYDHDLIMFMDDDDLLLSFPALALAGPVRGFQWIPYDDNVPDMAQINHEYDGYAKTCYSGVDFSGYTMKSYLAKTYFDKRCRDNYCGEPGTELHELRSIAKNLEDCPFMHFSDDNDAIAPDMPFVFHRLWENPRSWLKGI